MTVTCARATQRCSEDGNGGAWTGTDGAAGPGFAAVESQVRA